MTRVSATLIVVLAATMTEGCSSGNESPESAGPPAVCSSLDAVESSVGELTEVDVSGGGVGALTDEIESVKSGVEQLVDDARAEYAPQADQLERDFDELQLVTDTARTTPSAANLAAIVPAVRTLVDDVRALAADVESTC